jgi:acetyl/propionyl-CoA carboxylase alpha subunit
VNLEGKYFGDYQTFTEKYIGSPRTNLNEIIAKADKYGNE